MPQTVLRTSRLAAALVGALAVVALSATPASATICPGGNTGNPLVDYCVGSANWFTLISGDNPEAWYRLNDLPGATVMKDETTFHDGEYKNEQDSGPTGISADGNMSRDFWGENGYGFANGIPAPNRQGSVKYSSWTVEAWFYATDTDSVPSTHNDGTIMDFGRGPAIYITSGLIRCTNGDDTVTAPTLFSDEKWYMVVCRKKGNKLNLFVQASPTVPTPFNYTPAATGISSYLPEGSPTFYVGYGAHAPWFDGAIDEVMLFKYALTDDQIAYHFYADPAPDGKIGKTVTEAPPVQTPADPGNSTPPTFTDDSKQKPAANASKAAKLKAAKADVKRLTGAVAKLKKQLGALKYHHASKKTIAKVSKQLKKYTASLKRAKAKVKALS